MHMTSTFHDWVAIGAPDACVYACAWVHACVCVCIVCAYVCVVYYVFTRTPDYDYIKILTLLILNY